MDKDVIGILLIIVASGAIIVATYMGYTGEFQYRYKRYFRRYEYTDPKTHFITKKTRPKTLINRIKGTLWACFIVYIQSLFGCLLIVFFPLVLFNECKGCNSSYSNDYYEQYEHRSDRL